MKRRIYIRRCTGLIGLLGALLFFCGDMLFYGHWGSGANFHEGMERVVREASLTRLFIGGLLGPVAACCCIVGFWHVSENVRPRSRILGRLILYSCSAMMVAGSALHALWVPRGLASKYEVALKSSAPDLFFALRHYWDLAYDLTAVPAYLGAGLLFVAVAFDKSTYPRWTAIANFGLLSLLAPVLTQVPAPIGSVLVGGLTNLSIALFFLVSILSTWKLAQV